jgi:hypothetical protein
MVILENLPVAAHPRLRFCSTQTWRRNTLVLGGVNMGNLRRFSTNILRKWRK